MDIIFREIHEFGLSLILLDQHPSKISLYALGNTYCTICMNLKTRTDINAVAQCLLLDKEKDILGSLEVGQAVVKLQGRIAHPFQVSIPEFIIKKGRITDTYVKKHMQDIAPATAEQDFRLPADTDGDSTMSKKADLAKNLELAFLRNVQDHPDSGIAARYKRLSLSVRQGQKLKAQALQQSLIQETIEITKTGRIAAVALTDKGMVIVSDSQRRELG